MRSYLFGRRSNCGYQGIGRGAALASAAILAAMLLLLSLAGECRAFFYRPAEALSILSEYPALSATAPPHTQVWKVVAETVADGAATVRFFPEAAAGAPAVCTLRLPAYGSGGQIGWEGIGSGQARKSETGLLLAPGFPAPCDVLPLGGADQGRVYRETSDAGGRTFTRSYRVSVRTFTAGEARSLGWLRAEQPVGPELIMVTVTDEKETLVVRQLWPAEGDWWLYEETPRRRSWLIQ